MGHSRSFLDLFTLPDHPKLLTPDRFTVHGVDAEVQRASWCSLRPAWIASAGHRVCLLHGPFVTIDFSNRPFDTVEFDRMLAVLENLLPGLAATA